MGTEDGQRGAQTANQKADGVKDYPEPPALEGPYQIAGRGLIIEEVYPTLPIAQHHQHQPPTFANAVVSPPPGFVMVPGPLVMVPYTMPPQGLTGIDPGLVGLEAILGLMKGAFVKQRVDAVEVLTGCDNPNTYYVYERNEQGNPKKKKILKCRERSSCCARNCMSSDCKPFDMEIKKCFMEEDYDNNEVVLKLERECTCTYLCCNRPVMNVYHMERGLKQYVGKVVHNWNCYDKSYSVYDLRDSMRFYLQANCCQLGFLCQCPCDPCQKIQYDLWVGNKERQEAPIVKLGSGDCIKNCLGNANNFSIPFPQFASSWQDKALLLAAVLMIDYMQFDKVKRGMAQNIDS